MKKPFVEAPLLTAVGLISCCLLSAGFAQSQCTQLCARPSPSIVGWWAADGNTNDLINGNAGTLVNGAGFAEGEVGQAFSLNGIGQYVGLGNPQALQVSSGDFTVVAWVKFASLAGDMSIVDKANAKSDGTNMDGWRLLKGADNYFYFCLGEQSNACSYNSTDTARSVTQATAGTWFLVAAQKNSSYISIFINGMAEQTVVLMPFTDSNVNSALIGASGLSR